ncbi:ribosomal protein S6--L-glutamate ligase [Methanococcus voltae]|uniref:RimK domain protein ATP-grasp n=1 Tax=Methanococcus voltae (strain ATCC BAA-1334 / A3) TaxID=456320 RepID=D7DUL3_METV3|nr:ribosomal protein S6--L-glutamate ligase [Methanococcus voltae]
MKYIENINEKNLKKGLKTVKLINSSKAVETCQNKYLTYIELNEFMPKSYLTFSKEFKYIEEVIIKNIEYPVVVKPVYGGYGNNVLMARDSKELNNLCDLISSENREIFLQEYIQYKHDLRVFVLGNEVIGCMERIPNDSWKANYSLGAEIKEFKISEEIKNCVLKASKQLGAEIVGVDVLITENSFKILEMNITPQFSGMIHFVDVPKKIVEYCVNMVQNSKNNSDNSDNIDNKDNKDNKN